MVLKWRGQSYPIKGTIIKFLLKARQEIFFRCLYGAVESCMQMPMLLGFS